MPKSDDSAERPKEDKLGQDRQAEGREEQEHLATFSATAVRQASDGMVRFEVKKDAFEEQTGTQLQRGKVYAVEGDIEGVSRFRKIYDGDAEGDRLAFFPSKESSNSVQAGEKHDVHVDTVKEVSATPESMGTFFATGYPIHGREDSVRFDIPTVTFEKRTGFHFEEGKTYGVKGKIDGVHDFALTHTGSRDNEHIFISAPREHAKEIKPGEGHVLTVHSIEEKRTLDVSGEGHTTRLTLQRRALESLGIDVDSVRKAGEQDRLIELKVRNLSSADRSEKTVYGRVQPGEGALPLSIANIGAKHGDTFELLSARGHNVKNFVKDFNEHARDVTKNVRLSLEGKKLYLEVEGRKFQAKSYELDVHRLQTFLNLKIEPLKQDIRFWYDGERTTAKFAQSPRLMEDGFRSKSVSWRITSFQATERGLEVTFVVGRRTITSRAAHESLGERMSVLEISQRIKVDSGEGLEGNNSIRMEDDLVSHINDRITKTRWTKSPYYFERGGFGEDIGAAAMSKMGWDEVARHPFDHSGPGRDPFKTGSDALYRNRKTGELVIVEFRWWGDSDAAMEDALRGVRRRMDDERGHREYGNISGAYVASLSLELRSNRGELHVKRAW